MYIRLQRKWKKADYTIGRLFIDGEFICNTLEDTDRGLMDIMRESEILSKKVSGETAIPSGTYEVSLDVVSPKFSKYAFYKEVCGGKLPRLLDVKCFDGVLIHCGNDAEDTHGCILVGKNTIKGGLTESKECFKLVYDKMKKSRKRKDPIFLVIE